MTYSEVLSTLRRLDHKDKIRAIQFLANEVAKEEEVFVATRDHEFISQTDAFEAGQVLQKLIDDQKANAVT
jgi:hypothetical protein